MPDYGDEVAVAPCLDPDDTKAAFGVLVRDALDQPGQHLSIGWMGLRLYGTQRLAQDYSTVSPWCVTCNGAARRAGDTKVRRTPGA